MQSQVVGGSGAGRDENMLQELAALDGLGVNKPGNNYANEVGSDLDAATLGGVKPRWPGIGDIGMSRA